MTRKLHAKYPERRGRPYTRARVNYPLLLEMVKRSASISQVMEEMGCSMGTAARAIRRLKAELPAESSK